MELNLMTTDSLFANMNVVFDDSIFQVDEDTVYKIAISEGFKARVTFPNYAEQIGFTGNCYNYNQPVTIPNSVKLLTNCFSNCQNYNQPVNIPDGVLSVENMFRGCTNYNQSVTLPNSVIRCGGMFASSKFNQPITLPSNPTNVMQMFALSNFNSVVTIPNTATNLFSLFRESVAFNQPVTIPNSVINCSQLFFTATNYNQPVTIPDSVKDCSFMFNYARNFNSSVIIGNAVANCESMFMQAYSFNQPVIIPNGVRYCSNMFRSVTMFNSYVIIPPSVFSTYMMFFEINSCGYNTYNQGWNAYSNSALKAPIYFFANSVNNAAYMFQQSNSLSDIYITGVQNNKQLYMFMRNNGGVRCNIFTDETSKTFLSQTSILVNGGKPTWTEDASNNCIYNTGMNLYIYNTWDGTIPNFCRVQYFTGNGDKMMYSEYLNSGEDGKYIYNCGTNAWSDTPNGSPVTNILNNVTTNMNVYYAGTFNDDYARQKYNLSNYNYDEISGYLDTTNTNGGIILNGALISKIEYTADTGYSSVQTGRCQRTATLPTVLGGTGRISYSVDRTGVITPLDNQDIFLSGNNVKMNYTITFR